MESTKDAIPEKLLILDGENASALERDTRAATRR
jgi:hypothetical protein